jgi:hypothetical protein
MTHLQEVRSFIERMRLHLVNCPEHVQMPQPYTEGYDDALGHILDKINQLEATEPPDQFTLVVSDLRHQGGGLIVMATPTNTAAVGVQPSEQPPVRRET